MASWFPSRRTIQPQQTFRLSHKSSLYGLIIKIVSNAVCCLIVRDLSLLNLRAFAMKRYGPVTTNKRPSRAGEGRSRIMSIRNGAGFGRINKPKLFWCRKRYGHRCHATIFGSIAALMEQQNLQAGSASFRYCPGM